ncbi:MAG: Bax inhibitor-1/YccA family protein [Rickettsiaceae bacterium]|nr:Bax inhibitor-1/YccA family protein [Rickettsiaceae bacterium]
MSNTNMFSQAFVGSGKKVDSGLRNYMLSVYNLMCAGLCVTALSSFACMNIPLFQSIFFVLSPNGSIIHSTGIGMLAFFAPFFIGMTLSIGIMNLNIATAHSLFFAYAALTGVSLTPMLSMYTAASVAKTFLIAASAFGGMSIYGNTTRANLNSWGPFLFAGLFAVIIASIMNMFIGSSASDLALSAIMVVLFLGFTAYDTHRIKEIYFYTGGGEMGQRFAVMGAFSLYLDFINLFVHLLRFMGNRRD